MSNSTAGLRGRDCKRWCLPGRVIVGVVLCLGFIVKDILTTNFYMALVCMVNASASYENYHSTSGCQNVSLGEDEDNYHGTLEWGPGKQALLFAIYDFGLFCVIFVGYLTDILNGKLLLIFAIILSSSLNILTPVASNWAFWAVIIIRAFIGLCDAVFIATSNTIISQWFPSWERNTAFSVITGGNQIGTLISWPWAGLICKSSLGWPLIYYISGLMGLFWIGLWTLFGSASPESHHWIKEPEREFLRATLWNEKMAETRWKKKVPWLRILKSPQVWATIVGVFGHEFPVIMVLILLPSYLKEVYNYDVGDNGLFSALPTGFFLLSKVASSSLFDWIHKRFAMRKTTLCKALNTFGSFGFGTLILSVTFLHCSSRGWVVVLFVAAHVFAGFQIPGALGTLVTIAPAFSGCITGLAYSIVALSLIVGPFMRMLVKEGTAGEWNIVLYIIVSTIYISMAVFAAFGSADTQPWAKMEDTKMEVQEIEQTSSD